MSQTTSKQQTASTNGDDFTRDTTLELLSNRRRRFALHYLKRRNGEPKTVSEIAEHVASWENDKSIEELSYIERKRVRNALRQFHLPKMDDQGFVDYDADRGEVRLTDAARETNFYVDSIMGGEIPWGVYYLGLSAVGMALVAGLWLNVYPFSQISALTCGIFFVTALTVSSLGHFYDNYVRMRLGGQDEPPEVTKR